MNEALYSTNIGKTVEGLQDAGRNVWIAGFASDGRRALVVDADRNAVSVAHVDCTGTLGRWECTHKHYNFNGSLYQERFPRR